MASVASVATAPGVLGDEKKILMILCTRVKQEAETAIGESNLPGIDRPYKQALAEIDRGRGVEAVRDLIRHTEKAISSIRGPGDHEGLPGKDVAGDAAQGLGSGAPAVQALRRSSGAEVSDRLQRSAPAAR